MTDFMDVDLRTIDPAKIPPPATVLERVRKERRKTTKQQDRITLLMANPQVLTKVLALFDDAEVRAAFGALILKTRAATTRLQLDLLPFFLAAEGIDPEAATETQRAKAAESLAQFDMFVDALARMER